MGREEHHGSIRHTIAAERGLRNAARLPERKRTTTWPDFIPTHLALLAGTDFFTAEVLTLRGHTEGSWVKSFGPDRTILTIGGDNTIRLWDIRPHYLTEFKSQRRTFTMALSDGAKFLATQDMGSSLGATTPLPYGPRRAGSSASFPAAPAMTFHGYFSAPMPHGWRSSRERMTPGLFC